MSEVGEMGASQVASSSLPVDRSATVGALEAAYETLVHEVEGSGAAREGLRGTPARAARAWKELTSGYAVNIPCLFKTFEAEDFTETVLIRAIPVRSLCEHHLLPFVGYAHLAYIPDGRIVGLSKLARLVDALGRRLQVQERLTVQIAQAIHNNLKPKGCLVVIDAEHMCMTVRGVQAPGAKTTTKVARGVFETDAGMRAEALNLLQARGAGCAV